MQLTGLHHVTAVSSQIRENHRFYTNVLGMRLVKRSVNQDDVSAYHLFYADGIGSPGTDLTFFDWDVPREQRGTSSLTRTYLRVDGPEAIAWWSQRLAEHEVRASEPQERDGRLTLDFEDPEGQRLALIDDGGQGDDPVPWEESPVPARYQIRGLGPAFMSVPDLEGSELLLTSVLNMHSARSYAHPDHPDQPVHVYAMNEGGPHAEVHVAVEPDLPPAQPGAGGVHHVAFRTPDAAEQRAWLRRFEQVGLPNSGLVNRFYFQSVYLREPNGVLFEIATDGPGFAVDEDPAELGRDVALPPFLEPHREWIVANLEPID